MNAGILIVEVICVAVSCYCAGYTTGINRHVRWLAEEARLRAGEAKEYACEANDDARS